MATKRKSFSLQFKCDAVQAVQRGEKKTDVARRLEIDQSMLSRWIGKADDLFRTMTENGNMACKRRRKCALPDLEEELYRWFILMREKKAEISGTVLTEKAKALAESMQISSETIFSKGWLQKFQRRHNIVYQRKHGEKNEADLEMAQSWTRNVLPDLLDEYLPSNVFNADETAMYFRATPDGTLAQRGEKVSGAKKRKERLSVLVAANMDGSEKLPLLVIGKSMRPRCFKNKHLPTKYEANTNAWMTRQIFLEWLVKLDEQMRKANRRILLIVDRCPAHPMDVSTTNIKVVFLPANTTSLIQPMDAGIIRSLKAKYRSALMKCIISRLDSGCEETQMQAAKSVSVLDALNMLKTAWGQVTQQTIEHCFKSCFSVIEQAEPFESSSILQQSFENFGLPETFIDCDNNLECFEEETEDTTEEGDSDTDSHEEDEVCSPLEGLKLLDKVKQMMERNGIVTSNMKKVQGDVMDYIAKKKLRQATILDFFK